MMRTKWDLNVSSSIPSPKIRTCPLFTNWRRVARKHKAEGRRVTTKKYFIFFIDINTPPPSLFYWTRDMQVVVNFYISLIGPNYPFCSDMVSLFKCAE